MNNSCQLSKTIMSTVQLSKEAKKVCGCGVASCEKKIQIKRPLMNSSIIEHCNRLKSFFLFFLFWRAAKSAVFIQNSIINITSSIFLFFLLFLHHSCILNLKRPSPSFLSSIVLFLKSFFLGKTSSSSRQIREFLGFVMTFSQKQK